MAPLRVCVVAAAIAAGGCVDTSGPSPVLDRMWELAPGGFAEVNLELGRGQALHATFTSDAELVWDVHSHGAGGRVVTHDQGSGLNATFSFVAESAGIYSILLENRGAGTAAVEVVVRSDGRLDSVAP